MRTIKNISVFENYILKCKFSDGTEKFADISPFLQSEVFQPLKNKELFATIKNHHYFISWNNEEIDLSADTLWNIGVVENISELNS